MIMIITLDVHQKDINLSKMFCVNTDAVDAPPKYPYIIVCEIEIATKYCSNLLFSNFQFRISIIL